MGPSHQSLPWQAQMNNKGEMDALYKLVGSVLLLQPGQAMFGCRRYWGLCCALILMHQPIMQVEQLSRDVHRQQGVTISMAHNKGCA